MFIHFACGFKITLTEITRITMRAHIFIETPDHQYITWATNASPTPESFGDPNLLNIASPEVGIYAVVLSLMLSLFLILTMISTYLDARHATTN